MNVGPRQTPLKVGVGRRHVAAAGRLDLLKVLDCLGQLLAFDGQFHVTGQHLLVLLTQ